LAFSSTASAADDAAKDWDYRVNINTKTGVITLLKMNGGEATLVTTGILAGTQSGLLTRIAATENVSLFVQMKS